MVQKAKGAKASRASACNANEIKKKTFEMDFQSNLGARCFYPEPKKGGMSNTRNVARRVLQNCQIQQRLKLSGHAINLYPSRQGFVI